MTDSAAQWFVLVEENVGAGHGLRWSLSRTIPAGTSKSEALEAAAWHAQNYRPQHPDKPVSRRAFRQGECWLVLVEAFGRLDFHYRISVAELIAEERFG